MSYEGREVYLCENGHMIVFDSNAIMYGVMEAPTKCEFCETKFKHVGSIDDTNGDAVCNFVLTEVEKGFTNTSVIDGVKHTTIKPSRYMVKGSKQCVNFDTQEILTNYGIFQ